MNTAIRGTIKELGSTNRAILSQKVLLMESMLEHFGSTRLPGLYCQKCNVVGASIGQHFRHSLDHISRAAAAIGHPNHEIHYDLRERNTPDESDWLAAQARIESIDCTLKAISSNEVAEDAMQRVEAIFYLEGGSEAPQVALPSTLCRELGFAVHHAIHHMAMVRIIVQQQGLSNIPDDFGRAPSTVRHDNT